MSQSYEQLCTAVVNGDKGMVDFLLKSEKVDPNPSADATRSPLGLACRSQNLDIVRLLITNKLHPADPNIPDNDEQTPFLVALKPKNTNLVKIILKESLVAIDLGCICPQKRHADMKCSSLCCNMIGPFCFAV